MTRNVSECFGHVRKQVAMLLSLIADALRYVGLCLRPSPALAAENLFLRKQRSRTCGLRTIMIDPSRAV